MRSSSRPGRASPGARRPPRPLAVSQLQALYRATLRIRRVEERIRDLYAAGRMPGFIHLSIGQEGVAAGACAALRPDDFVTRGRPMGWDDRWAKDTEEAILAELDEAVAFAEASPDPPPDSAFTDLFVTDPTAD